MSDSAPAGRYTVFSIDNGSFSTGALRTTKQEFNDLQSAIAHAQGLVDAALILHFHGAKSAHELMTLYTISGSEVPKIHGEPRADFHAYQYAREKAEALFASP